MWQTEKGGGWLQVVLGVLMACAAALTPCKTHAADVKVAIAANFTEPAKEIAAAFEKVSGHKLIMSFGATGQFYAQIAQGAPFDILLAADQATPKKAIAENLGVAGSTCHTVCLLPGSTNPFDASVEEGGPGKGGCPVGEKCDISNFKDLPSWFALCSLDGG